MTTLALDIGGANIKASDGADFNTSVEFPLWQRWRELDDQLRAILAKSPSAARIAVTMTGELADCYASKAEGVVHIADCVTKVCHDVDVRFYLIDGRLVNISELHRAPLQAAASNWHALAKFCSNFVEGRGLLLDIGSTTCDIIPIANQSVTSQGTDDTSRLIAGELLYMGVERTPVNSLIESMLVDGVECPIARELFATSLDAHLVLDNLPEQPGRLDTADGRGRTKDDAVRRLARMCCADVSHVRATDILAAAQRVADRQADLLATAIRQVMSTTEAPDRIIISGHGDFLADAAIRRVSSLASVSRTYIADIIGADAARCAPAHALAILANDRFAS